MRLLILLISVHLSFCLSAQFEIRPPIIDTLAFEITDTVYMAPNGQDDQSGSYSEPVQSFQAALDKLPFGQEGVNGGHAYGLIMLKPGYYETSSGFHQFENNWKMGNTYKHVSLEGMGEVSIGGKPDSFAQEHLLFLRGDHIFIKNIRLQYSRGIGILLNRNSEERQKHVLIEDVEVDSVGSFSMLLRAVDTLAVKSCTSMYASRPGNDDLTSPCQWPSGIKFFDSNECSIRDSEIAFTRGEGLNFHNSYRGVAFRNQIHDNGLNIYNDNSSHISIYQNLVYNTPGTDPSLWRNCPANTSPIRAPRGLLIANEGACDRGSLPVFENCHTQCVLPEESFPNVDSMFVFNNIFQNVGSAFAFWQGTIDIAGRNCIRNVFIFNNTVIGSLGMEGAASVGLINAFFPNYNLVFNSFYGFLENVNITHNIFTYDTLNNEGLKPVSMVFHPMHPGPMDIQFDHNIWVQNTSYKGDNGVIRKGLPGSVDLLTDTVDAILPCPENAIWQLQIASPFPFLGVDYLGRSRDPVFTNVGALEYTSECDETVHQESAFKTEMLKIYPNPCRACSHVYLEGEKSDQFTQYQILSWDGRVVNKGSLNDHRIDIQGIAKGSYLLLLLGEKNVSAGKLILM